MAVEKIPAKALDGIAHGFLGRVGGVSTRMYAGLNVGLGSDDDRASVMENRRLAINAVLPDAALATVHQVHSADVITISSHDPQAARPHADAMVTNQPGILLGILTADCVPVLFADQQARVIGAAHSGWKGALYGVNENTISAMEAIGADRTRIVCAIGPCISQKSYEVDDAFLDRFAETDPANERFFGSGRPGRHQFDIEGYVAARLASFGIKQIECLGLDTYSQPDRFYSYRRTCHQGENDYGRQISLIGLRNE